VEPIAVSPMNKPPRADDVPQHVAGADDQDPEAVREEIEQTRAEMTGTIDEIQARLNPDRLKGQAKEAIHDATIGRVEYVVNDMQGLARGAGNTILGTIRQHPLPAALVGVGLGWLLVKGRETARSTQPGYPPGYRQWERGYPMYDASSYDAPSYDAPSYDAPSYGTPDRGDYTDRGYAYSDQQGPGLRDRAGQATDQVQEKAGQLTGQAQDKVGQVAGQARDTAQQVGQQVRGTAQQVGQQVQDQARQAQGWMQRTMRENPLTLGAVALALGAAVGMSVPETRPEHQLLGPARDNLVNKAQDATQDTVQRVQSGVREANDSAQDAAQNEAQRQGLGTTGTTTTATNTTMRDGQQPRSSI
jgi:hypothetical protein